MAKGMGAMMASTAMALSSARDRYAAVIDAAGLDSRICPLCGWTKEYEWDGSCFCCTCFDRGTERTQIILSAAREAGARYRSGVLLTIVSQSGERIGEYSKGRRNPTWYFEFGAAQKVDCGLRVEYPEWWPHEALKEYDAAQAEEVSIQLETVRSQARELGIVIFPEPSEALGSDGPRWCAPRCAICGQSETFCPGAKTGPAVCSYSGSHPELLLSLWRGTVERRKEFFAKRLERQRELQADQKALEEALAMQGFFRGRIGSAEIPGGAIVVFSFSHGDRHDPIRLIGSPQLTLDQLRALVAAAGDRSRVELEGENVLLRTPNPGQWIGRRGSTIKALSAALGRFIRVVEES